jgi:hypothetical protein
MDTLIERRFAAIGARVRVAPAPWRGAPVIDVLGAGDGDGECFTIGFRGRGHETSVEVVDVRPRDRHLLLLVRQGEEGESKSKFLCGHDERRWFVAAVPEAARGVTGVATAMEALQPEAVRRRARSEKPKARFRRRNGAFVRQGEWFFVPAPGLRVDTLRVSRNEPLSRGAGKAHVLELAFRRGGETVYVGNRVLTQAQFNKLPREKQRGYTPRTVNPELYAQGTVRHPDHATIELRGWHRVLMNTEREAAAMRHVAFID